MGINLALSQSVALKIAPSRYHQLHSGVQSCVCTCQPRGVCRRVVLLTPRCVCRGVVLSKRLQRTAPPTIMWDGVQLARSALCPHCPFTSAITPAQHPPTHSSTPPWVAAKTLPLNLAVRRQRKTDDMCGCVVFLRLIGLMLHQGEITHLKPGCDA